MAENRGSGVNLPSGAPSVGMPARVFLFTIDQIAVMLSVQSNTVAQSYLYYEGRSIGSRSKSLMVARNIAPADEKPEWRVAERELVRWLRFKGFRYYDRGAISG